ncbi:nucleotidyl transferase AbiEii/AbiGii toxin family protein [Bradyrhizobium sp. CCGB12]|uniref:nucleotidyl transferase AbiEii/AbiGii toxin family protein n=1 Tax=Bradyrhizobium sp. CCGB12 TaxID=2949632 RepID=UPI0020B34593|nr:nucleotidyl transferase AbiEii/AbiGii toxin family protein [Bradyrhizobium sp. CCGB12]MCP3387694.1 nucleotidyl transferase AbiEii/AbiGii toxin family protein [Bradyrhizobium sp. CCGB12]
MDTIAKTPAADRAALFNEAGAARGLANAIIEKDFWVCWTLKRLFGIQSEDSPDLVFKGGTSLSKAYGAIRRFSEDIDLSFDRADLGYEGARNPEEAPSRKKADRLIEDLVADVEKHIADVVLPTLTAAIAGELGPADQAGWSLTIEPGHPQNLIFEYPSSLSAGDYAGFAYMSRRVKLEFGARGDPWPTEKRQIKSYAAQQFPDLFADPACTVDVLALRRTFWEKATALHAEHHREPQSPTPPYFSRHYYDLATLADTDEGKEAMMDGDLLKQVADHKSVFFRAAWANYDTARVGTLRLSPHPDRVADLRADYRKMAPMMFDDPPPTFDAILDRIAQLEKRINGA